MRALILAHKLFDGFGVERKKRTLFDGLVVELPEVGSDVPWHHEVASCNLWALPRSGKIGRGGVDERSERRAPRGPFAQVTHGSEVGFAASVGNVSQIICQQQTVNVTPRIRTILNLDRDASRPFFQL